MADYLDFPDIFSRLPNWSFALAVLGMIVIVIKVALRSAKKVMIISFCVLIIYLLFNLS